MIINENIVEKGEENETIDEKDVKKEEDVKNYQDFVFTIDDRFKRHTVLDTSIENCIIFEMTHGEIETTFAYTTVQMDDLHSLVSTSSPIHIILTTCYKRIFQYYTIKCHQNVKSLITIQSILKTIV